ncbi:hypothetical protein DS2_02103 [Catenovulum agarivorans DS-2]|uniref:SMP-30/Gluconolactonase/LRE-like region domain-containing protein n=1 Tax=Catenovulum agarivorans DS-2 TaxID=1328313 RepID=W7QW20_9ALTE|nr:SMP-30/gluconolactonase/LRE family protein [Catenovulum agarivorans]EWH11938.1 hypothetical protein DS2_02103 [Catenovulum agarivorans DS-2]
MLKNTIAAFIVPAAAALTLLGCGATSEDIAQVKPSNLQPAKLFAQLPDSCPTPDAFDIAPDGSLTLSCVNYANKQPGMLLSLSATGEVSEIGLVPAGKRPARPMGIAYAPDGSLFVADNAGKHQGRLIRLTFNQQGKIATSEVVAQGMTSPNGVRYHNGFVYLTQLQLPKAKTKHLTSGVYRFKETDRNINVASDGTSKHLIYSTQTKNPDRQFGIDGLVFDKAGALYVGNLGDAVIHKLTLDANGVVVDDRIYAQLPNSVGPDGINIDAEGNLYLAGFLQNEIYKIDTNQKVTLLAKYPDNNGANGEIDQPADLIVYQGKLVVSNFDLMKGKGIVNSGHGKPYTVSYIEL